MRLLRLDLLRYGIFTNKSLHFRPDARVHIVYGPNEAGKSTALSAIGDLLYGVPNLSPYNFSGDKTQIRLGADIINQDGTRLEFHRIKSRGLSKTLRTPGDELLPDESLAPFIGHVDRRMFMNAFGLSTNALRIGSRAMLDHEGEIGAALLGAASGVGDLQTLQKRLEEEADDVFKVSKRSNTRFSTARKLFTEANEARKASELTAPKWKSLNAELETLSAKLERLRLALHENATRTNRLVRLASVRPIINRISHYLADIETLGDLPRPTATFTAELGDALAAREKAQSAASRVAEACLKAEAELADITLDEPLIASARAIDDLVQKISSYDQAIKTLGGAEDTLRRANDALTDLIADLGIRDQGDLTPQEVLQSHRPSLAAQELLRELINEREDLDEKTRSLAKTIQDEQDNIDRAMRDRDALPSLMDPGPFRTAYEAFEADLAIVAGLEDLRLEVSEESRRLIEEAGRLAPAITDLDHLATVPRPGSETINRYRIDFDKQTAERAQAETALAEARLESTAIRQHLAHLQIEGEVVTREALEDVRAKRDASWAEVKAALTADERPDAAEIAIGMANFEIATARADALADTAIRDAERIEAFKQRTINLQTAEDKVKRQLDSIMLIDEARATLLDIWTDEWRDMGIAPLPPAEMAEWLQKVEGLLDRRELNETKRARLALIEKRAEDLHRPLDDLASQIGLVAISGLSPQAMATRIKARLDELSRTWDAARSINVRIQDCSDRLASLHASQNTHLEASRVFQAQWAEATAALGLKGTAGTVEARAALGAFERLPRTLEDYTTAFRQLDQLRRTISDFESPALALAERIAPDLNGLAPDEAVGRLAERLRQAREAYTRKEDAELRLTEASVAQLAATSVKDAADARLQELRHLANLGPDADLEDLFRRLSKFEEISQQLALARTELAEQTYGESEEDLRAALVGFDPDGAKAEQDELARAGQQLNSEMFSVYAGHSKLMEERDALERGAGAELALQRRAIAESEMASLSREWLVLKLAAALVAKATARHRAGHHVPLIDRASALFHRLTGGSFSGLITEETESGGEHLVGRRPDGSTVAIGRAGATSSDQDAPGGMSEGTLDQLYLAMRLAHLEEFARTAEPVPFIGDDLFMTFDDTRTSLGLEALADTSSLIQPIIFTHHARVADIARFRLGEAADVIEL